MPSVDSPCLPFALACCQNVVAVTIFEPKTKNLNISVVNTGEDCEMVRKKYRNILAMNMIACLHSANHARVHPNLSEHRRS